MTPALPSFKHESQLWDLGVDYIAGIDEVGVGCLAGPVVAAAVIFRQGKPISNINDSKQLSAASREDLNLYVKKECHAWAIGEATVKEIDNLNILRATRLAMRRALERLKMQPETILVDGFIKEDSIYESVPTIGLIKGDRHSISIAAASILAKVYRDNLMIDLSLQYPQYGFDSHKGYGTKKHLTALKEFGATSLHRSSYAPVLAVKSAS